MRTKAIDKLTDSQVFTLAQFIGKAGAKYWRAKLAACFDAASYRQYVSDGAPLQQIRNAHGMALVKRLKTAEVLEAAQQVAAARGEQI